MQFKARMLALGLQAVGPVVAQNEDRFTANCNPTPSIRFTAPKDRADNMIYDIPDGEWEIGEGLGYSRNLGGSWVCAAVTANCEGECGNIAFGRGIRDMARFGFEECVRGGGNDTPEMGSRFYHYTVTSPIFHVRYGGGPCPGTFSVPGSTIPQKVH